MLRYFLHHLIVRKCVLPPLKFDQIDQPGYNEQIFQDGLGEIHKIHFHAQHVSLQHTFALTCQGRLSDRKRQPLHALQVFCLDVYLVSQALQQNAFSLHQSYQILRYDRHGRLMEA